MNNNQGKRLLDSCDIYDLDTLIKEPTRISTTRASCLDVILSNVPMFMKSSGAIETGISDHLLVYTVLKTKMLHANAEVVKKRIFKTFNRDDFQKDLSRVPFHAAYVFDDIDDVYWCWETLYNQVLDDHAPMRSFKRRSSVESKFITPEIRREMVERKRLKKKFNRSRNQCDWESYRLVRNKVVSMRRKSIRRHFEKLCSEKYADQKKFWRAIKPYVNSRKNVDNSGITLKEGDKTIRNPQEVTETLNNFFTSCTQSTKEQNQNGYPVDLSHISNNLISRPNVSLSNTNPTEVYEVMRKLAPNKASGCDGIPPLAVKESMDVLCFPLSTLINHVLTSTKIPQQWKLGEVTPILKKDCSLLKTNYRPITILPAISKVFEKTVHCRISPYFEEIYHKYVFAYRKYHGCDSALLSLTEQWKKEIDNNKLIGLVSMDLSKAFDTLPHELIVLKLKEYGVCMRTPN